MAPPPLMSTTRAPLPRFVDWYTGIVIRAKRRHRRQQLEEKNNGDDNDDNGDNNGRSSSKEDSKNFILNPGKNGGETNFTLNPSPQRGSSVVPRMESSSLSLSPSRRKPRFGRKLKKLLQKKKKQKSAKELWSGGAKNKKKDVLELHSSASKDDSHLLKQLEAAPNFDGIDELYHTAPHISSRHGSNNVDPSSDEEQQELHLDLDDSKFLHLDDSFQHNPTTAKSEKEAEDFWDVIDKNHPIAADHQSHNWDTSLMDVTDIHSDSSSQNGKDQQSLLLPTTTTTTTGTGATAPERERSRSFKTLLPDSSTSTSMKATKSGGARLKNLFQKRKVGRGFGSAPKNTKSHIKLEDDGCPQSPSSPENHSESTDGGEYGDDNDNDWGGYLKKPEANEAQLALPSLDVSFEGGDTVDDMGFKKMPARKSLPISVDDFIDDSDLGSSSSSSDVYTTDKIDKDDDDSRTHSTDNVLTSEPDHDADAEESLQTTSVPENAALDEEISQHSDHPKVLSQQQQQPAAAAADPETNITVGGVGVVGGGEMMIAHSDSELSQQPPTVQENVVFGEVARRINCVCGRGEECYDISASFFDLKDARSGYALLPSQWNTSACEKRRRESFLRHVLSPESSFDYDSTAKQYIANHHFHPKLVLQSTSENLQCHLPIAVSKAEMTQLQMNLTTKEKVIDKLGMPTGEYFLCPNYPFAKAKEDALRLTRVKRTIEANCKVTATNKMVAPVAIAAEKENNKVEVAEADDELKHSNRSSSTRASTSSFTLAKLKDKVGLATADAGWTLAQQQPKDDEENAIIYPTYKVDNNSRLRLHAKLLESETKRRDVYGPKMYVYTKEWKCALDILRTGLQEVLQLEKFVMGQAHANKAYAEAMRAIHEDDYVDEDGNVPWNWKPGILSNRRQQKEDHKDQVLSTDGSSVNAQDEWSGSTLGAMIETTSVLAKEFAESSTHMFDMIGTDLITFRKNFQHEVEHMEKLYGKVVMTELEHAELRVGEAWNIFHSTIHLTSCNSSDLGVTKSKSEKVPTDSILASPTNATNGEEKSPESPVLSFPFSGSRSSSKDSPKLFSKDVSNTSDLWLMEMKYRVAVDHQRSAWEVSASKLSELTSKVAGLEAKRQEKLHSVLLDFVPRQRRLSSNCASIHRPVLNTLVQLQMDQKVESDLQQALRKHAKTLQRGETAHRSQFINRSKRQKEIGDSEGPGSPIGLETLRSPISSDKLSSKKIIERRVKTITGFQGWQPTLAMVTTSSFLHLFDLPPGVDASSTTEMAFYSLWPNFPTTESILKEKPAKYKRKLLKNLIPAETIYLPHCSTSVNLEPSRQNEFELTETSNAKFGVFGGSKTKQVLLRTRTAEDTTNFMENNLKS